MAELNESIYGNQEMIEKHAGDPKPKRVPRLPGLGQESPEQSEGEIYENTKKHSDRHVGPKARPSFGSDGGHYVVSNQKTVAATVSRKPDEAPVLYDSFDEPQSATNTVQRRAKFNSGIVKSTTTNTLQNTRENEIKKKRPEETIELREVKSGAPFSTTTSKAPEITEKVVIERANRCPVLISAIAILLALAALVVALLFGFGVIKEGDGCNCKTENTKLQSQLDELRNEMQDLRKQSRSEIVYSSSTPAATQTSSLKTAKPSASMAKSMLPSSKASTFSVSVTHGISAILIESSPAMLSPSESSASISSSTF